MLSLQQIKRRIRSIESTAKITKAMQMISVVKLRQITQLLSHAELYMSSLNEVTGVLLRGRSYEEIMLQPRLPCSKTLVCLIMSDTGLCGAYNSYLAKTFDDCIARHSQSDFDVLAVGSKAVVFLRRKKIVPIKVITGLQGKFTFSIGRDIGNLIMEKFIAGTYNEVTAVYSKFKSIARHAPAIERILPISAPLVKFSADVLTEPEPEEIIVDLFFQYVQAKINTLLLGSFASEHASRMISMQTATDNAAEILENLVLTRNKVRQTGITREMIELISSSESLKE